MSTLNGLSLAAIVVGIFVGITVWAGVSGYIKSRKPFELSSAWTPPDDVDARHRTAIAEMFTPTTGGPE